ncbi:enoyl-CoA hydratase/isomerase family protein [Alkalimarinus sediminis]|uniref:Enoyl-CoA hydratase-related protein n=1 Tax=Alkalimarinus sediminis TaxID=1632866 RepID=A0A9E8HNJ8_9ALTE|nr:enoyl-CoA hydratase/isomerase family protein [Alkalimarinus sediminis]UZW76216.1 enoyl-CoA hydratase-related protein [Alkalimarinus sediminis]
MDTNDTAAITQSLLYDISAQGVAHITINRPKIRNAFDQHLIAEMTEAFQQSENDQRVRLILLSSNGPHFSAGADLNWMKSMVNASHEENLKDAEKLEKLMSTINYCSKPVVTKVKGAVYGGGVGLVACSDIVLAEETSSFALSEVKLGLSPATIAPFVIDAIGSRAARHLFLTGEVFDASKALRIGLVGEVLPSEKLDAAVEMIITKLLNNGPRALISTKALIEQVHNQPRGQALTDYTCKLIAELRTSDEGQEGLSAFLNKRKPSWSTTSNSSLHSSKTDATTPSTDATTPSTNATTPSTNATTPSTKAE